MDCILSEMGINTLFDCWCICDSLFKDVLHLLVFGLFQTVFVDVHGGIVQEIIPNTGNNVYAALQF